MLQYSTRLGATLLVALLTPAAGAARPPEPDFLVTDLAPGPQERSASPAGFVPFGDRVLFLAEDPQHGKELWTSDGTPQGTRLVLDACPGPCSGVLVPPVVAGERYFFTVLEAPQRFGLWVGDAAGVRRAFLFAASFEAGVQNLTALGDRVVFAASDPDHGVEPWVSDGTPEGTRPLADLCAPGCSSYPAELAAVGETVFFRAAHADRGQELFLTDGTPEGTRLAAELCPSGCDGFPTGLFAWRGRIWFTATRPDVGFELWSATPGSGARLEADFRPGPEGSTPFPAFVWQDRLYLQAWPADGFRWLRLSEPGAAPQPAAELAVGPGHIHGFTVVDGALHLAETSDTGSRLWVLDGTGVPARLLASLEGGVAPLGALGGSLFYIQTPPGDRALWRTDGTVAGTRELRRFDAIPWLPGGVAGGRLLFAADGGGAGLELWAVGAVEPARRVRNLAHDAASSAPHHLTAWGEDLAFLARGTWAPWGDVWRARGHEVTQLTDRGDFFDLVRLGESLVAAREGELWRLDVGGETTLLHDGQHPVELSVAGSRLFYGTFGAGQEVWTSDGTPEGTRLVVDPDPTWSDECPILCPSQVVYPRQLTALGDGLAFVAAPQGREAVWVSDGTPEGTAPLAGGQPFDQGGPQAFEDLTVVDDALFFVGVHYPVEVFLPIRFLYRWRPGLPAPERVADLTLPAWAPPRLAAAGGRLFFARQTPKDGGDALWVVGPRGPARRAHRFRPAALPAAVRALEPFGDGVLVSVLDLAGGDEPWVSGGRPLTTVPLGDLAPGSASSRATGLVEVGGCGLFAAAGDRGGHELWLTGGRPEGTRLVANLARGARASSPAEITAAGDLVYFTADDGAHGRELFALERSAVDALCPEPPAAP